mmetsp:Transcript_3496/g.8252  ORF Transcript_3496/g.8252 Transcript_3496/m.8252 type:complete len:95 (+) Transcript_3496:21-305(+)
MFAHTCASSLRAVCNDGRSTHWSEAQDLQVVGTARAWSGGESAFSHRACPVPHCPSASGWNRSAGLGEHVLFSAILQAFLARADTAGVTDKTSA